MPLYNPFGYYYRSIPSIPGYLVSSVLFVRSMGVVRHSAIEKEQVSIKGVLPKDPTEKIEVFGCALDQNTFIFFHIDHPPIGH